MNERNEEHVYAPLLTENTAGGDFKEEEIRKEPDGKKPFCDICLAKQNTPEDIAIGTFMCFFCEKYICSPCFIDHNSHHFISCKNENRSRNDSSVNNIVDDMMIETLTWDRLRRNKSTIRDRVCVKHPLDKNEVSITGLCGLGNNRWAACDFNNKCIKVFKVGSNVLIHYLRFTYEIYDVAEVKHPIHKKEDMSYENGAYAKLDTSTDCSCVLAVTVPERSMILFLDMDNEPISKIKGARTPGRCRNIDFINEKIFVLCDFRIIIMTVKAVILKIIRLSTFYYNVLDMSIKMSVSASHIYILDPTFGNVRVADFNGTLIQNTDLKILKPKAVATSESGDVYLVADTQSALYVLDSNLQRDRTLFNADEVHITAPTGVVCYKDRLYLSHSHPNQHIITIVQLQ